MDTGSCAAPAAHGAVDPAAMVTPVGGKKRPDMTTDAWTGTKKHKTSRSREDQVHGLGGGGSGEASSTAVLMSRKRPYEYSELELDVASSSEKMFKCNYWEDPAYAKRLQYFGLQLARSVALDHNCDRLTRAYDAWMAGAAATPISD